MEELSRRRYGPLTDKGLEPGGFRELTGEEVEALRRAGEEVAGEVGKEVQGPPVMLAADVADAPQPMSDAALVASDGREELSAVAPPEMEEPVQLGREAERPGSRPTAPSRPRNSAEREDGGEE